MRHNTTSRKPKGSPGSRGGQFTTVRRSPAELFDDIPDEIDWENSITESEIHERYVKGLNRNITEVMNHFQMSREAALKHVKTAIEENYPKLRGHLQQKEALAQLEILIQQIN